MNGIVDDELRALIEIPVAGRSNQEFAILQVWIDTAFNGALALPHDIIRELSLKRASETEAELADGHVVKLATYSCHLEWFGQRYQTQVIASDSHNALLGTALLGNRKLFVDYAARVVTLE